MADLKQLQILKQGVEVWNEWRKTKEAIHASVRSTLDLSNAELSNVTLSMHYPKLSDEIIQVSYPVGADLSSVNLAGANLSENQTMTRVNFIDANLDGADLSHTYMLNARFMSTKLVGTDFSHAGILGAYLINSDLSKIKGLETVVHSGPSYIDLSTLYKSGGNIPEKFLRGCGVPDDFITYSRSLTAKAIELYSCFISYSSKDEEFAKRLYNDLQSEGVRCWFAPEDLKIGDKFRVRIDESIRLYDKLLLVLSENSVASQWVEKEVETAFEKEGEQGKTVLFPVQLDDAVTEIKTGWAADVRRSRHIGDFRDWKNHDSYRKAFERLMRDLKAEASR